MKIVNIKTLLKIYCIMCTI